MKTYRVWVEIEEYDDRTDEYNNQDFNAGVLREFSRLSDASEFANQLHDLGEYALRYVDKDSCRFLNVLYHFGQFLGIGYRMRKQKGGDA